MGDLDKRAGQVERLADESRARRLAGIQEEPSRALISPGQEIGRLDSLERLDIALVGGIERQGCLGGVELRPDIAA